jgi:hypothetical protein
MKKAILFLAFVVFAYLIFMLSEADRNGFNLSGGYRIDPAKGYYNPDFRFRYTFEDFQ